MSTVATDKVLSLMRAKRDLSLPDIIDQTGLGTFEVWQAVAQLQSEGQIYFDWEPDRLPDGRNGRKTKFTRAERLVLESWLLACGWRKLIEARPDLIPHWEYLAWLEPDRDVDWSLESAVHINAEVQTARRLVELGYFVPYDFGVHCGGRICRAPGTFDVLPGGSIGSRRGSGGRWLTLSECARKAGLL